MSETARQIIEDAMSLIQVFPDESSIQASETALIIRILNRMMSQFESKGINLGYTTVTASADTLTVPDAAIEGIISNLAMRIAPHFLAGEVPIPVQRMAEKGEESMRDLIEQTYTMDYPSNLPAGSGNYDRYEHYSYNQTVNKAI